MKFLIILSFALQLCYSIDVKFNQFCKSFLRNFSYFFQKIDFFTDYKGIKRIEIPSCESEPCVLHIGQQLPVKITFEAGLRLKN